MKVYKFTSTGSVLSAGLCGAERGPLMFSQSWWPHRMLRNNATKSGFGVQLNTP